LFLIGQFLKIFSSETAWPNDLKRDEMSNRNSGLSIDASYQLESKTSANQKQESPVVAMFANGSG
jgi:hypothetical protein